MAILEVPESYILKRCEISLEDAVELLNKIGFPTEVEEGNVIVEVTPDRLDMLTYEGVVRAINTYLKGELREYVAKSEDGIMVGDVEQRPYIVGFVARDVKDTEHLYEGLIAAQEKIHQTFGRKRKKIAIGVHDLDKVRLPLKYVALDDVAFTPLDWNKEASIKEILENHEKGKIYGHLVSSPFPLVIDEEGVVSFPPIINSERTKITKETRNFLVEITGSDEKAIRDVAKVFCVAFIDRGGDVSILKNNGEKAFDLSRGSVEVSTDYVNKVSGMKFNDSEIEEILKKSDVLYEEGVAKTPCYRYDLTHRRDLVEEVLINYGYEKIFPESLEFYTVGRLNKKNEEIRKALLFSGFVETVGFFLIKGEMQERFFDNVEYVLDAVSNEHNSLRVSTILTLLSSEHTNQMERLPHKFFEIGEVYRGGRELSEVGFLIADKEASIERGVGVIKRVGEEIGKEISDFKEHKGDFSSIFIEGRAFEGKLGDNVFVIGEIRPEINEFFGIPNALVGGVLWEE